MENENPYLSQVFNGKGEYDWTLAKRMFLAFAALTAFYLLCSAVSLWQSFDPSQIDPNSTILDNAKAFLGDWRAL